MLSSFIYANQSQKATRQMREGTAMSSTVNGANGTYRNAITVPFAHGSLRVVLDQTTPLLLSEAQQVGTQADKLMGRLVSDAFKTTSAVSDYIENRQVRSGSSSTEGSNWQEVGKLHVRVRVALSVDFAVPEFVLSEAVDLAVQYFRSHVRAEMDPSYKAFVAEEKAREAAMDLLSSVSPAAFVAAMLVGENAGLGIDGSDGMIVGSNPFASFGGNGFGSRG